MSPTRFLLTAAAALSFAFAQASPTPTPTTSTPTPLCSPEAQGIVVPTPGTIITQIEDANLSPTYFEVVYCSGAYFKTSSLDASVLLARTDTVNAGELLIKNAKPDDSDSEAGFQSYRFNVSLSPSDGDYVLGERVVRVYETTTGYYNPYDYQISEVNVTFAVQKAS